MALALHRPSMVRHVDWAEKNVDILRNSNIPADRELAAWTDLQFIAEESAASLGLAEDSQIRLKDNHTQTLVKTFERQLAMWKDANWNSIHGMLLSSITRAILNSL